MSAPMSFPTSLLVRAISAGARRSIVLTAAGLVFLVPLSESQAGLLGQTKGELSVKTSVYASRTRHTFNSRGNKVGFMFNGRSTVLGSSLELLYGLTDRTTLYANIPFVGYNLSDDFASGTGSGLGDAIMAGRVRIFSRPIESHFELGLKFPTADTQDVSRVLVGEGQYDVDMSLLLAAPLGDPSRWLAGQIGYRYRTKDVERNWKPGNELIYRIEGGYRASDVLGLSLALSGFRGGREESFDLPLNGTQRELMSIIPALSYRLMRNWAVRVDYSVPLDGRNYFAGGIMSAAIIFSSSGSDGNTAKNYAPSVRGVSCCLPR